MMSPVKTIGAVTLASVAFVGFLALKKPAIVSKDTLDEVVICRDTDGRAYEEGTIRDDGKTCRNGRWT